MHSVEREATGLERRPTAVGWGRPSSCLRRGLSYRGRLRQDHTDGVQGQVTQWMGTGPWLSAHRPPMPGWRQPEKTGSFFDPCRDSAQEAPAHSGCRTSRKWGNLLAQLPRGPRLRDGRTGVTATFLKTAASIHGGALCTWPSPVCPSTENGGFPSNLSIKGFSDFYLLVNPTSSPLTHSYPQMKTYTSREDGVFATSQKHIELSSFHHQSAHPVCHMAQKEPDRWPSPGRDSPLHRRTRFWKHLGSTVSPEVQQERSSLEGRRF